MSSSPIILFIDTETNGLDIYSDLIQISWILSDVEFNILVEHNYIINPEGFKIKKEIEELTGITNEFAQKNGYPLNKIIALFKRSLSEADYIVGHNIHFDIGVLNWTYNILYGYDAPDLRRKISVCTMKSTIEYCAIEDITGKFRYKFPTLSELYKKIFDRTYNDAHNAINDVIATFHCFKELVKTNILCQELNQGVSLWDICDSDNFKFEIFPKEYEPKIGDEVEIIRLVSSNCVAIHNNVIHDSFNDKYHLIKEIKLYNNFCPDEYFWFSDEYESKYGSGIFELLDLGERLFGENGYVLLRTSSEYGSKNEYLLNYSGRISSKDVIFKRFKIVRF